MRLPICSAALGIAVIMSAQAYAQGGAVDPVGTWLTEDGRAKIRTEHCGDSDEKLCGFVVWMKDPLNDKGQPRTDIKNPDPAKRGRPSLGMEIMEGLKAEDKTHFAGEIYNADDGKKYNVTVGIEKPTELEVQGCLLRFLCGSQTWARVADLPVPNTTKVVSSATKPVKPVVTPTAKAHDTGATLK